MVSRIISQSFVNEEEVVKPFPDLGLLIGMVLMMMVEMMVTMTIVMVMLVVVLVTSPPPQPRHQRLGAL